MSVTLALLNDLTVGYTNVRRLLKTEEVQLLLRNHAMFDFIANNQELAIIRSRTNFYAALMRLWNIELEDDPSMFDEFMKPITGRIRTSYLIILTL